MALSEQVTDRLALSEQVTDRLGTAHCEECQRLAKAFSEAVQQLMLFEDHHFRAAVYWNPATERYEPLI